MRAAICVCACALFAMLAAPANAEMVSHERDIVNLRLGHHVYVDDGSCPSGQIKQVVGAKLTTAGVLRKVSCVPRSQARR